MIQALITDEEIRPGEVIKRLRTEKGLTISELSRATGLSKSAISRWESGKRLPSIDSFVCVLAALDTEVAAIRRPGRDVPSRSVPAEEKNDA